MKIVRQLDEQRWNEFVSNHPDANVFHTPEMYQVFARARGHRPELWAAVDGAGHPMALLLPVQVTLLGGPLRPFTTRAVAYGGTLCSPEEAGQTALAALLGTYRHHTRGRALFTELRNVSDLAALQPALNGAGFAYEPHLNYLIDLQQSEETLWRSINRTGRQGIRAAFDKKGLRVTEITQHADLATAYGLLQQNYARVRVPLADRSLFEAAFDLLGSRGMFKAFLARAGETCVGANFVLAYNGRVTGWYAAGDRAASAYRPMDCMAWDIMRWGQRNGYRLFDFGGAGKPDQPYGPRDFKAKFGGELVEFGRNTCVHAPLALRLSRLAYNLYRDSLTRLRRPRSGPARPPAPGEAGTDP